MMQGKRKKNHPYQAGVTLQSPAFKSLTGVLCRNRVVIFSVGCF